MRAIKEDNPQHRITFLCHSMGRTILENSPYIDELILYNEKNWHQYWNFALSLRKRKFSKVFDFMANPRSAKLAWLTRAPERYSFSTGRDWAFNRIVPRAHPSDYVVREKFKLLRTAGFEARNEELVMPWSEKDLGPYKELMQKQSFASAPFKIALSPTHRKEVRRWPLDSYKELAERLIKEKQAAIVWTWGPGEKHIIDELIDTCTVPTFASPKTTLQELTAMLSHMDLFVGNSNGASHFAVASGCSTLKISGPNSEPQAWSPLNERHRSIDSSEDIRLVKCDDVWDIVNELL